MAFKPSISTINAFPREIGRKTAELVLHMRDRPEAPPQQIEIQPKLLIRESCC